MALKEDYKDAVFSGLRKYKMVQNNDGTVSFVDVTEYAEDGDKFGAKDVNAITEQVNSINTDLPEKMEEMANKLDDLRTDLKTVEYPQITWAEKVTRYSCTLTKFFDTYIKGTIYAYATSTSGQIKITKGTAIRDASFADRDLVVWPVGTFEGNLFNLDQDEYAAVGTSTGVVTTTDSASTNIYRCSGVAIAKYDGEKTTLYGWKDTTTSARCTTAIVIDYCIVRTLINKPPVAYPDGE